MQVSAGNNEVPRQPTITDVARAAGVSRAAASRVLNDVAGVSPEVRQRVRGVIDQIGYRPNPAARALASGRSGVLDLVVVDDCPITFGVNPYFGRVIAGVLTALAGGNGHLRVHMVPERDAPALLSGSAGAPTSARSWSNVPTELAAGPTSPASGSSRSTAPARGCRWWTPRTPPVPTPRSATCNRLAGGGSPGCTGRPRCRARWTAVAGTSKPCGTRRWHRSTAAASSAGRSAWPRPAGCWTVTPTWTRLFVACDLTATGALQALAAAGRRVPDDVAVVGYDDSLIAACAIPALTSVRQPVEEMAEAATRALLDHRVAPYWRMVFPAELVVRHSS